MRHRHTAIRHARVVFVACAMMLATLQPAPAGVIHEPAPDPRPQLGLLRPDGSGGLAGGIVHALARQPDGKLLVGGQFTRTADGTQRTHLLRLNGDGTLDADFNVAIVSASAVQVRAIAVGAEGIFIGGAFTAVGGQLRNGVALIGFDGQVAAWSPALGSGDQVHALALAGEHLYVGGDIVTADAFGVARLSRANGSFDSSWYAPTQAFPTASLPSSGSRGRVHALVATGQDLIVGGYFRQIGGQVRNSVARLSLATPVTVSGFVPPIGSGELEVFALALHAPDNTLYIGGDFFSTGQQDHLLRVDAATGLLDPSWLPQPSGEVRALALAGRVLYVGGRMDTAAQQYLLRAATSGNGAFDPDWQPLPDAVVHALDYDRGAARLHVGGAFAELGLDARNGLGRYSMAGAELLFRDGLEPD